MIITRTDNREARAKAKELIKAAKKLKRPIIYLSQRGYVKNVEIDGVSIKKHLWHNHLNKDIYDLKTLKHKSAFQ